MTNLATGASIEATVVDMCGTGGMDLDPEVRRRWNCTGAHAAAEEASLAGSLSKPLPGVEACCTAAEQPLAAGACGMLPLPRQCYRCRGSP